MPKQIPNVLSYPIAQLSLLAMITGSVAACATDEVADDVAEAQQAFTGNDNYSWGDTTYNAVDIGTSVGRTCFLTGIGGGMRPSNAYLFAPGPAEPAQAGVRKKTNGNYELYVQPSAGFHLIAYARCVNSAAGRIEASWWNGAQDQDGDKVLGPATSGRECFLQEIQNVPVKDFLPNSTQYTGFSWGFDDRPLMDEVRVAQDNGLWKMSVNAAAHSFPIHIAATAVCVNAAHADGAFTVGVNFPGAAQVDLTNKPGATCGLTGVRGNFTAALGDWDDSINISQSGTQFKLNVKNGKRGWARCMD